MPIVFRAICDKISTMDYAIFAMTILIPVLAVRSVRPAYPLVAVSSAAAASWLVLAAELIPLPLLWEGPYGNFYWILCLITLAPAWLIMALLCLATNPEWRKLFLPTVIAVIPAFVIPYVCQEVFRRGFEFLAPALLLAMVPLIRQAWRKAEPERPVEER